jgi:hypothetical protein
MRVFKRIAESLGRLPRWVKSLSERHPKAIRRIALALRVAGIAALALAALLFPVTDGRRVDAPSESASSRALPSAKVTIDAPRAPKYAEEQWYYEKPLKIGQIDLKGSELICPWDVSGDYYDGERWGEGNPYGDYWEDGYRPFDGIAVIPPISPQAKIVFVFEAEIASFDDVPSKISFSPKIPGKFQYEGKTRVSFIPNAGALKVGDSIEVTVSSDIFANADINGVYAGSIPIEAFSMGWYRSDQLPLAAPKSRFIDLVDMYSPKEQWKDDIVFLAFTAIDPEYPRQPSAKISGFKAEPSLPRFVMPIDGGTGLMGRKPVILLFDQSVNPTDFKGAIAAKGPDGTLAVKVESVGARPEMDYYGVANTSYMLAVTVSPLPPDGSAVSLDVPSFDRSGKKIMVPVTLRVFTSFEADSPALEDLKRRTADFNERVFISFNGSFRIDDFDRCFTVSPDPRNLSVSYFDEGVLIEMDLMPGTVYRASIDSGFTDLLGNPLLKPFSYEFTSRDLDPYFETVAGVVVLEKDANRIPVKLRNVGKIVAHIIRIDDPETFLRMSAQGTIDDGEIASSVEFDASALSMNYTHRADLGIDGDTGLKAIVFTAEGSGSEGMGRSLTAVAFVQTTAIGLSCKVWGSKAFVWATSLKDGSPVEGAMAQSPSGRRGSMTNEDGVATIDIGEGDGYVYARLEGDISILRLDPDEMSHAWQFDIPEAADTTAMGGVLFADRGAYRPGETAFVKFFASAVDRESPATISLRVVDSRGETVMEETSTLDEFGGTSFRIPIKANAATGKYSVSARAEGRNGILRSSFFVEEYRIPDFSVSFLQDSLPWVNDEQIRVRARASYYSGQSLDGRDIAWRVFRQPERFESPWYPGYTFDLRPSSSSTSTVASGKGVLNDDGEFAISFLPERLPESGRTRYIVEAVVTDIDRQTFAGRTSKVVEGPLVRVGIKVRERKIYRSGSTISMPVVVVDANGEAIEGRRVRAFLESIEYHQTTMEALDGSTEIYNREVVSSSEIRGFESAGAQREYSLIVREAGTYRLRLSVADDSNASSSTAFEFTVTGDESVPWPRFDKERIELIADKPTYKVGETAILVAQSPYPRADALLTIESNGVIAYKRFEISNNTPSIEVPMLESYQGRIYVSVILVRGREHRLADATGFETGAPGYKIGYAALDVERADSRLAVETTHRPVLAPGQTCEISLRVSKGDGSASAASVALMVVDEAVLALTGYATPDPSRTAFAPEALDLRNASNILDLPYSRRARNEELFPGGDSDASVAIPPDRGEALRKLFKSTAYWNPDVRVGADGTATVSFTLPDNLTTYRVMAVASDGKGRFGSCQSTLAAKKPLMVRVSAPRFARIGDSFSIEATVFNETGKDTTVELATEVSGLNLTTKPTALKAIKAGESGTYGLTVMGSAEGNAKIAFRAKAGANVDSVEIAIRILPSDTLTIEGAMGIATPGTPFLATMPKNAVTGSTRAELVLSGNQLSSLSGAIRYLIAYPHGCIEQTTSSAWPLILLKNLLPLAGISYDSAAWREYAEAGLARILTFVTPSGGLSYWPGENSPHLFGSAYGAWVLTESKRQGFSVPDAVLRNLASFLEQALKGQAATGYYGSLSSDDKAFLALTLGKLGKHQKPYIQAIWSNGGLSLFGLSCLAVAWKESGGDHPLLADMLGAIGNAIRVEDGVALIDHESPRGYSFSSSSRSLGAALLALSTCDPSSALIGPIANRLILSSANGRWGNTQENAFAIMGLTASQPSQSPDRIACSIGGRAFSPKDMKSMQSGIYSLNLSKEELARLEIKDGALAIECLEGPRLVVNIRFSYDVDDRATLAKVDKGFQIERLLFDESGKRLGSDSLPSGSLIEVRLRVTAKETTNYVAITDNLPAAFEALNMALATTEAVARRNPSDAERRGSSVLSYSEIRDDKVLFYANEMPAGTYEFAYYVRITGTGSFSYPSARAEAMYLSDRYGTSGSSKIAVK